MSEQPKCEICGEPMPPGEEMFKFHGYSGNCPKPPLPMAAHVATGELAQSQPRDLLMRAARGLYEYAQTLPISDARDQAMIDSTALETLAMKDA